VYVSHDETVAPEAPTKGGGHIKTRPNKRKAGDKRKKKDSNAGKGGGGRQWREREFTGITKVGGGKGGKRKGAILRKKKVRGGKKRGS